MNETGEQYSEDQLSFANKHNLSPEDFWEHHGNLIIKHNAVMRIAEQENIRFRPIERNFSDSSDGVALMIEGDRYSAEGEIEESAWAFGEADVQNCKNPYLWCMAEKRGKDRVTLQLLGGYWHNIMSDVEADEFRQQMSGDVSPIRNGLASPQQISHIEGLMKKRVVNDEQELAINELIKNKMTKDKAGAVIDKLNTLPVIS